jgi:hypothetical protein
VTCNLAQERRIRDNLGELRRLLADNPERAARFREWLAGQREEAMNEKAITLRLPADLLAQADALVDVIADHGEYRVMRVTRSTVLRLALLRGIEALTEEFARRPKRRRSK